MNSRLAEFLNSTQALCDSADAPYELARFRTYLASAFSELGNSAAARLEIESARVSFALERSRTF